MSFHITYKYPTMTYSHSLSDCPEPSSFERHCHGHYELLYVTQGEGRYIVESAEYPLQPNTLLLIRPYEFHYVCPKSRVAYERLMLYFSADSIPESLLSLPMMQTGGERSMGVYFSESRLDVDVRRMMMVLEEDLALFEGSANRNIKEQTMLQAELTRILLRLSLAEPEEAEAGEDALIPHVLEYLNLNLEQELSLDRLAQRFFVSKYYLCHAFHKHTGVSVFAYLNAKRIALAQRLLEDGEPAGTVADRIGFRNYSSFYRTFVKLTGHAPIYSREREKEKQDRT